MQEKNIIQSELEKKVRELSFLSKINNIIGFLPLEQEETLTAVTNEINKLYNGYSSYIFLFCQEHKKMEVHLNCTPVCSKHDNFHRVEHISRCRVGVEALPVIVQDITKEQGCSNRLTALDTKSYVCIPISFGKELLGSLTVECPHIAGFSRDDLQLLVAVASQLAFPIHRTRLYRQLQKDKDEMARANEEINKLNRQLEEKLKELKQAEARLIQSEKLAATGRMAANLAHEINNPVGIILSSLDYLMMEPEGAKLPAELLEELQVIAKHSRRIAALVNDLLLFARDSGQNLVPVDLLEPINKTIIMLGNQLAKAGVEVSTELAPVALFIKGNQMKLEQVFCNLLQNAWDAMPEGGKLIVRTGMDPKWVRAVVEIEDEGIGIREEDLVKIFDPFFTTKETGKGTGLGLSIVYNIVKEHQGAIEVKSSPGSGTIFTVHFPLIEPECC